LRDFIYMMKGNMTGPCRATGAAFACAMAIAAFLMTGCDKLPGGLFSRGGTDLSFRPAASQEYTYQSTVDSSIPSWTKTGSGSVTATLRMKIRCRASGQADADGIPVQGDILDGQATQGGKQWAMQLMGQKVVYRISELRRISQWQGLGAIPVGPELFSLEVPKGKVKSGETWKVESDRFILQLATSIRITRNFSIKGEEQFGGEQCLVVTTSIPAMTKKLESGITLDISGNGSTSISKKDGRIVKAIETLQGSMTNPSVSQQAAPFTQSVVITELSSGVAPALPSAASPTGQTAAKPVSAPAPSPIAPPTPLTGQPVAQAQPPASLTPAVPAKAPTAVPAAAPTAAPSPAKPAATGAPVQAKPASAATSAAAAPKEETGPFQERLVFVSRATGRREVWSVAPDGTAKRCLTPYTFEHWYPSFDPDGKVLACASRRSNGVNLWSFNMDNGASSPLTEFGEVSDIKAAWTFGGKKLVFIKDSKLWAIHRDGFNMQSFDFDGPVVDLAATPMTAVVAVVVNVLNQMKIQTVEVNSGAVRDLFEGDLPDWSPDGGRMVYRNVDALNVARSDGTGSKSLFKGHILSTPLRWDPSGRKIMCTIQENEAVVPNVLIINEADGISNKATSRGGIGQAFSVSGDKVVYLLHGDIWIATLDGAAHVQMTTDGGSSGPVIWGKQYVAR